MTNPCKCDFLNAIEPFLKHLEVDFAFTTVLNRSRFNKKESVYLCDGNFRICLSARKFEESKIEDHIQVGNFYWHEVDCARREIELGTIGAASTIKKLASTPSIQVFIPHYNESEIAHRAIQQFVRQGIPVTVIDDGSNDLHKKNLVSIWASHDLVSFEFQDDLGYYDWSRALSLIDRLARESKADWIIRCDSDEEIRTPNGSSDLSAYIHLVDSLGFNIIDTTGVNLKCLWGDLCNSLDATHYQYHRPNSWRTVRAWKNYGISANLSDSGGHSVNFKNEMVQNLVFPFNLTLLHMPLRNENQTRQKINDRISRGEKERIEKGWHTHLNTEAIRNYMPTEIDYVIDNNFWNSTLFERLTRFGIKPSKTS